MADGWCKNLLYGPKSALQSLKVGLVSRSPYHNWGRWETVLERDVQRKNPIAGGVADARRPIRRSSALQLSVHVS